MNTLRNSQSFTSVAFTFSAHSDDGSLEDALERLTALMTALFAWIQLQLSIADVAQELVVEMRVLMQQANIALGLLIEVLVAVLKVIHWIEDVYNLPGQAVSTIRLYPIGKMVTG